MAQPALVQHEVSRILHDTLMRARLRPLSAFSLRFPVEGCGHSPPADLLLYAPWKGTHPGGRFSTLAADSGSPPSSGRERPFLNEASRSCWSARSDEDPFVTHVSCLAVSPDSKARLKSEPRSAATVKKNLPSPSIKPLLLKRHSKIPKMWEGAGGTTVLVDKPKGWSSFAVCDRLRTLTKVQKAVESLKRIFSVTMYATCILLKLAVRSYQAMTKVYVGSFRLGELTPSADADTEVSDRLPWEHIQDADITAAAQAFVGDITQVPPMYSAIKVKGERLYKKARRGEELDIPPRPVTVYEFQVSRNKLDRQELDFRVVCSKGTYIRSLCGDLGRALNSYAHLTALRREKIGDLSVNDAWTVPELHEEYTRLYL